MSAVADEFVEAESAVSKLKPTIQITADAEEMVDRAELALENVGGVYVRARALVHVVRDHGTTTEHKWLRRSGGDPVISELGKHRLREMIGSGATWVKWDGRSKKYVLALVPDWIAPTLKEREQWNFPPLDAISETPVLRHDGSIHATPGYDDRTRTIFEPGDVEWPTIEENPSHSDAVESLADLIEPFCNFPFVAETDRYAAVAMVLSMVARPAIDGCVPAFVLSATAAGSGKGLIADVGGTISTGRIPSKMRNTTDDNEMGKRLLSLALSGVPIVVIDNIDGVIGTPSLDMALTAGTITDRLLGGNEMGTASIRAVFVATGNNVQFKGDLGRRVVPIDLDPRMENPEDRVDFRYPELLAYVRGERPRLVAAALTLLRAYVVAGRPFSGPAKGSYEAWDRLVRGAILWAGGADPLGGVERVRAAGDTEKELLRALLAAWHDEFGGREVTVSEVLVYATAVGELRSALDSYRYREEPMTSKLLGAKLARVRGRVVGGRCIEHGQIAHGGARKWCVVTR